MVHVVLCAYPAFTDAHFVRTRRPQILLKSDDEELSELVSLTPEQLLVRWANYQLSDDSRTISHLGPDLSVRLRPAVRVVQSVGLTPRVVPPPLPQDCVGYALLLHSLAPAESAAAGLPSSAEVRCA